METTLVKTSRPIRVSPDVYDYLSGKKTPGEGFNDVIRREIGMPPRQKQKPGPKVSV